MSRRRHRVLAALVVLAGACTSACTISTNDEPVELSGTVPYGLLETTTTTTTTSVPEAATKEVTVYLLDNASGTARLAAVERNVDVAADVAAVLANLFTVRPDGEERPAESDLTTAIPESAALLSASRITPSNRLLVDVRGLFGPEGIQGVDLRNALAQIVWTATDFEDVDDVVFANNGTPVQALIDDSVIADGPVDRDDYAR